MCAVAGLLAALTACGSGPDDAPPPDLAPRGQTLTSVKPTRQDLSNSLSLNGKVTMNPIFGVAAPVAGEVRFTRAKKTRNAPAKPTKVATVTAKGKKARDITLPVGSAMVSALVEERSTVAAGMPVVSGRLSGYGIVADIDGAQAYRISDSLASVRAQIKNGPGPFACAMVGTIAALPPGTVPAQAPATKPGPSASGMPGPDPTTGSAPENEPSEATGLRLVCTAPANVKLINGVDVTLELVTGRVTNALVVPVEAVAGLQGKGKVDVVGPDKTRQTTDVVLGMTDGKVVEIKSGLTGTETLAVPGPNLPPAESNDEGKGEGR